MLTYIILVTEGLLAAAVCLSLLYVHIAQKGEKYEKIIMLIGYGAGFVAGAVMSYLKNNDKTINTGLWNLYTYLTVIGLFLLLIIISIPPLKRLTKKPGTIARACLASLLGAAILFYTLPDVLAYPFKFDLADSNVLSTDFLFRFIGYLLGILLIIMVVVSIYHTGKQASGKLVMWLSFIALGVNSLWLAALSLRTLITRRMIDYDKSMFELVKFTYNNSDWFIYLITACAAVLPIAMWVKSMNVKEPYSNPAQHRKIRKKWKVIRRWSAAVIVCFVLSVMNMTVIEALNTQKVVIAPPEEHTVIGDDVCVSLEQVSDGHLHRFSYETESGIGVRFIVIQKPNSQNFGVGLDACDICGETGYYERDGQVVCKLCDVVMNINTIGFKGGCNPIVINYSISDGYIRVPISELVAHEKEFK